MIQLRDTIKLAKVYDGRRHRREMAETGGREPWFSCAPALRSPGGESGSRSAQRLTHSSPGLTRLVCLRQETAGPRRVRKDARSPSDKRDGTGIYRIRQERVPPDPAIITVQLTGTAPPAHPLYLDCSERCATVARNRDRDCPSSFVRSTTSW